LLAGCRGKVAPPPPRYAILRFENLSGDASLDWTGRAASEVLSYSLAGALDGPVLNRQALNTAGQGASTSERASAALSGATRLVSGFIERVNGDLRISASEEDLTTHKTVRILSAEAAQPLAVIQQLAHSFSPSARPSLTSNPAALKLYATALDEPPDRAIPDLRAAVGLDPRFGPAWLMLVDASSLRGDRAESLALIGEALGHKLDPADDAAVRLQKAALEGDKAGRIGALRDLSRAAPADLLLLRRLAETEAVAGKFAESAVDWDRLRQQAPNSGDAWNQFGYALAWSGDRAGALKAMKEYAARWPEDPNPLDSSGDVEYMFGGFGEAAAYYLKAHDKDPRFLNGGTLYKAAWAQFRAGDRAKADATFAQFRSARAKPGSGLAEFEGDWLYRTGREQAAVALVRKQAVAALPAPEISALWSQLVIWDLLAKDRAAAARDAAILATKAPSNMSGVARFAALPSASSPEWRKRADTMLRGGAADAVRRFALGVGLLLDGKKDAARPVWDEVVQDSSDTDFFVRAVDAKLRGEKTTRELVPDSMNLNQLWAVLERL
jgi:TolB-like protein